jgi:hypothetical protein
VDGKVDNLEKVRKMEKVFKLYQISIFIGGNF